MKPMMIIAVCALLTACIKNDADPAPQKEIVFDAPVLSAVTKAGTTRNATEIIGNFPTDAKFSVYAHYFKSGYTSLSEGVMYMDDVTVMYDPEKGTNGGWVPGKKYYWPMDGFLTFAAYHPIYGIGTVSYGETGFTIDGFEVEDDPEKQIDLLFSERAYDMTSTDQKDANLYYYGVQLNFLHALSSIVFKIRADGSLVGDGTAGYEFKVKKIELLDVYDKGRFNQNLSPAEHHPSTPEASLADWICNVQSKKDYIAFDGSVTPLIVNTSEPVSTVSGDNKANLILLPQNLDHGPEKVKLRVVYDLRHKNMTEGEYVTDNVVETELTTSSVSTWLRGKRYIYTITLGLSEIRLTPKIENWVNSDAPNISI